MQILPRRFRQKKLPVLPLALLGYLLVVFAAAEIVEAASTSTFNQTINPGTLTTDIVDTGSSYASVTSPSITMGAADFSFSSQTSTGTFGSSSEAIYVKNPDAADTGWTLSLAASATTATWNSTSGDFDFNDAGGAIDDGATTDADSHGGQMTVDPSGGTIAVGACSSCATTGVTTGSSTAYVEGTTDEVTLMQSDGTEDIGDWTLTGVSISQEIPAEQPADSYTINMTLSVTAV